MDQEKDKKAEYRDKVSTISESGDRVWVYPKKPKGTYYNYRKIVSYILILGLIGIPFIKYNGEPFILLNLIDRNFILFGIHFTPQDFFLFAMAMLTFLVFILLFTVIFGRIFCGWICPQTIFMEMVFRRIEYAIEGDFRAQKKLNAAPWDRKKIIKKVLKHTIFIIIAFLITNVFLSWIIGVDEVYKIITEPISTHLTGFISMFIFTAAFYGVFAFFREQVCTNVCPYGRLQGVMLDKNSIVVGYDNVRGEPRGKKRKNDVTNDLGDCVDCNLCVQVCPTGIDIRNGTQLECVNCTACMDACDEVMLKIGRPTKLIRYDSLAGIEEGRNKIFTTRVWGYTAVLGLLLVVNVFLFSSRADLETLILKIPGQTYLEDKEEIKNLYSFEVSNKTNEEHDIEFKIDKSFDGGEAVIEFLGTSDLHVLPNDVVKGRLMIRAKKDGIKKRVNKVIIEVYSNGKLIDKTKTNFLGPYK